MDNINLKNFGEIISTEEYIIDKEKKVVAQFNYKGKDVETKYTTGDILISSTYIKDDNNVIGYHLTLGLNNIDKPITINREGDVCDFLKFIESELRKRHLHYSTYSFGYKVKN